MEMGSHNWVKNITKGLDTPPMDDGSAVSESGECTTYEYRKNNDKKLLRFFLFWLVLLLCLNLAGVFLFSDADLFTLINGLTSSVLFAMFFTGFIGLKYNINNEGRIIPTKKVLKWMAVISLVFGFIFTGIIYYYEVLPGTESEAFAIHVMILLMIYLGGFIAGFLSQLVLFITSFGVMGVISAWLRGGVPDILVEITKITPNTTDSMKEKNKKVYGNYSRLGWFFSIPHVIDTKTLSIKHDGVNSEFPWSIFKRALKWELFLGTILVIYISFNPFLLNVSEVTWLVDLSLNISFIIPMLVLPWFILLRLDAKIKGAARDFSLFSGLSQRVVQSFVAFGTIILIVRLAVLKRDILALLQSFITYYMFFTAIVVIFTFVYFNYFNENLARDIFHRYEDIKD
jgi:hypothetical protein